MPTLSPTRRIAPPPIGVLVAHDEVAAAVEPHLVVGIGADIDDFVERSAIVPLPLGIEIGIFRPDRQRDLAVGTKPSGKPAAIDGAASELAPWRSPLVLRRRWALDEIGVADEIGDEAVDRPLVDVERRAELLDLALPT